MLNIRILPALLFLLFLFSSCEKRIELTDSRHNLRFEKLASTWDEAIPIGNAMLGKLIWQNGTKLRFSLDRADLWDLRPMPNLETPEWKYRWVYEQWKNNNYRAVQEAFDRPYDELPAPSKIPACALEFEIDSLGEIESVVLDIRKALCEVRWKSGTRLLAYVHATGEYGWYRFENLPEKIAPVIITPAYARKGDERALEMSFHDLDRLGYSQGKVTEHNNSLTYDQEGWDGFRYQAYVEWKNRKKSHEGCWSISSQMKGEERGRDAYRTVKDEINNGFEKSLESHISWWDNFWSSAEISVPDTILERQWYLEMYKFGSAARKGAPPISLQAVWTADNGKLPPWKGDFHNDLNTQLSYWPAYSGNHLDLEEGFIDWLFDNRETFRRYTKSYFEVDGLNVPGVATLAGEPMGGWIQYSFGPTVSAWLSHHFYLHWRYSMDRDFLKEKAYPWLSETALFLQNISITGDNGKRKLPISSSPEIFNNSAQAWFPEISNYDLALIRWTFEKTAELADELTLLDEAERWRKALSEWPDFSVDEETGFMFTKDIKYEESHRHFSHLMAFHPLGLIDYSNGEPDRSIIDSTLKNLILVGPDWWCGYSYSWLGNLYARALKGEAAAGALRTFAECFCLPNSFHVNGDQTRSGKSKFTYRPFTLEGNFAFAAGLQEMLIQSHTGIVNLFPAIPGTWEDVSFRKLRTEGAFLVSASMTSGLVREVSINSEKGGEIKIRNPFSEGFLCDRPFVLKESVIHFKMSPGETVLLKSDPAAHR